MDNGGIADRLDALASLLELADANPYTARAYRRAADTIRDAPVAVADLCAWGASAGYEGSARDRGAAARAGGDGRDRRARRARTRARARPRRPWPLSRADRATLDRDRPRAGRQHARRAPRGGGGRALQDVPGVGPQTEARLLDALAREDRPRRALLLSQARELVDAIAIAMDGEVAGDVRRWRDACELLVVVCAPPIQLPRCALRGAAEIVAVIEQTSPGPWASPSRACRSSSS